MLALSTIGIPLISCFFPSRDLVSDLVEKGSKHQLAPLSTNFVVTLPKSVCFLVSNFAKKTQTLTHHRIHLTGSSC